MMFINFSRFVFAIVGLLLIVNLALASDNLKLAVDVGIGQANYKAKEFSSSGALLNSERGNLNEKALRVRMMEGRWLLRGQISEASALIDYAGLSQLGAPIITQTDLRIERKDVFFGYRFMPIQFHQIDAGLSLSRQSIQRNILPSFFSTSLNEQLRHSYFGVEAGHEFKGSLSPELSWSVSSRFRFNRAIKSRLDLDTLGAYDSTTLKPNAHSQIEFVVEPTLHWRNGLYTGLRLASSKFNPGSSSAGVLTRQGLPAASVSYPGSRQAVFSKMLVIGFDF